MAVEKAMASDTLVEVIDAWVRVSLVGIELLTTEARVVIASVETFLRYAEAVDLTAAAA